MSVMVKTALIQTCTPATSRAGLAHITPLIRQAVADGAEFVLTPEGSNFLEQRKGLREEALSDEATDEAVIGLQIFINDQHIGGCDELHALDAKGGLDPLLAA